MFAITTTNKRLRALFNFTTISLDGSTGNGSSSCINFFTCREQANERTKEAEKKLKQLYMNIIEFFAAFFTALLSTLSLPIQMSLIFARSLFLGFDMQRWSKSDGELFD
jgi:hypothetical protein